MNFIIGAVCLAFIITVSAEDSTKLPTAFAYHRRYGIPKANGMQKSENNLRIAGNRIDIKEVPYLAGLVISVHQGANLSLCGGALISQTRVLTAAHCQDDGETVADSFTVVLGSDLLFHGGVRIFTKDVAMHPEWNTATLEADIAVLRIPSVTLTEVIRLIRLPTGNEIKEQYVGWPVMVIGWGLTGIDASITNYQGSTAVNTSIISNRACNSVYSGLFDSSICADGANGKTICEGDSGGPLVTTSQWRKILIGVASYAYGICEASYPSVFTRVTSYVNWIRSQ